MEWYYAEDRQQKGPVSEEKFAELVRNGIVRADTLVWKAGMSNWQPYSQVAGSAAPPPPPPPFTQPASIPASAPLSTGVPPQSQSQSQAPAAPGSSPSQPSSFSPGPAPFANVNQGVLRERALTMVKPPAICLMILAVLCVYHGLQHLFSFSHVQVYDQLVAHGFDAEFVEKVKQIHPVSAIVFGVLSLLSALLIFLGAYRMMNLKSYGLAMTAAILAMLPCTCPCCCLGIAFGIWTLVVLNNAEVKSQFS